MKPDHAARKQQYGIARGWIVLALALLSWALVVATGSIATTLFGYLLSRI